MSLVLNGHCFTPSNAARRADLGLQQNLVNEILADYRNLADGRDGWMRIMTFGPNLNRIERCDLVALPEPVHDRQQDQFSINWHSTGMTSGTGTVAGSVFGGMRRRPPHCMPIVGATVTASGVSVSHPPTAPVHFLLAFRPAITACPRRTGMVNVADR